MHSLMVSGQGTRDLCGPSGLTTEQFVDEVATKLAIGSTAFAKPVDSVGTCDVYQGNPHSYHRPPTERLRTTPTPMTLL